MIDIQFVQKLRRRVGREASLFWQSTGRLHCPVCEHSIRNFLPIPSSFPEQWSRHGFDLDIGRFETGNFSDYSCPFCGASDRDRLMALHIKEFGLSAPASGTAIEFAPSGPLGRVIRESLPGWKHRTADLMMPGVDDKVDILDMRGTYADATIGFFVCSHVLEHVADDRQALSELYRITRPGGQGIILAPIHLDLAKTRTVAKGASDAERWRDVAQDDHERLYAAEDFRRLIRDSGFKLRVLGKDHFTAEGLQRCGIASSSVLYVVEK